MSITKLPRIEGAQLKAVQKWCQTNKGLMIPSNSSYAKGRFEMPVRLRVGLGKKPTVSPVGKVISSVTPPIEEIGESLLPGFHQGLVLRYPPQTRIAVHRDAPAYALVGKNQGLAAQINAIGCCTFFISESQDANKVKRLELSEGDCIQFDNKQPHGIDYVQEERWCICFFYLKKEFLEPQPQQLALFSIDSKPQKLQTQVKSTDSVAVEIVEPSSAAPKTYSQEAIKAQCRIDWEVKEGAEVYVPLDKKGGKIEKIIYQNSVCPGLAELRISYFDGTKESIYACQCVPQIHVNSSSLPISHSDLGQCVKPIRR